MFLAAPLAFPLGGEGLSGGLPWIINLEPSPDDQNVKLLRPVRFSIRDAETFIDPATVRVKAGYAKIFSNGDDFFDKLPLTKRVGFSAGILADPTIELTLDGVRITKTSNGPQRSIYATSVDAGQGYASAMATAKMRPLSLSPFDVSSETGPLNLSVYPGPLTPIPFSPTNIVTSNNGAVFGLEHGPRNKVVYLWFQINSSNSRLVRLTSYLIEGGSNPTINTAVAFDWSAFRRYTIVWNEAEGYVELYGVLPIGTSRLFRVLISSVPDMPADYFAKAGDPGKITMLYGQTGPNSDSSEWANVAITTDVGYPVLGNIRPGDFVTQVHGAELTHVSGDKDPRDTDIVTWFDTPPSIIADPDTAATSAVSGIGAFTMTKATLDKTFSFYREEPGFLASNNEGFMVQARLSATNLKQQDAATGMGITIFDGQTVFQFQLFNDFAVRTIGLLKKSGTNSDITQYFTPVAPIDWKDGRLFRVVVDSRRDVIRMYDGSDLSSSVLDIPFARATLPSGSDFGWDDLTPFVAFGHTMPTNTQGTFYLYSIDVSHVYQAWDGEDEELPTDVATDPVFTRTTSGGSTAAVEDDTLLITSPTGGLDKFHRNAFFSAHRGAVLEARVRIENWRPRSRTGTYLLLDDGLHAYALTFVENNLGRFVALAQRANLGGFQELVGRDGAAAKVSFPTDWTVFHTYRIERWPYDGVKVFLDNELTPRITFPETKLAELPDPQFGGTPKLAFGQFSTEESTSRWSFVRGFFSRGYEVSFKKNKSDRILRDELFKTQAIVVAHAADTD